MQEYCKKNWNSGNQNVIDSHSI